MFEYFYHALTKKAVIAFGSLFNDIYFARFNSDGSERERVKVPLAYMTKQKFLTRIYQNPALTNDFYMTLPRMSFEFNQFTYDATRKNDLFQRTFQGTSDNEYFFRYGRIPYNILFNLHIYGKNTDDCLQILEQILPWWSPEYSVNIRLVNPTDMSVDVPFIIQNVTYDEGGEDSDFNQRKTVSITIEFLCKMFYYGPVKKLPVNALGSGESGEFGNAVIPKGMIGKVVATLNGNLDAETPITTIVTGVTGDASPLTENLELGKDYQTYLISGKYIPGIS
jgi:hypothetical protein